MIFCFFKKSSTRMNPAARRRYARGRHSRTPGCSSMHICEPIRAETAPASVRGGAPALALSSERMPEELDLFYRVSDTMDSGGARALALSLERLPEKLPGCSSMHICEPIRAEAAQTSGSGGALALALYSERKDDFLLF